jgi:hypothetical protein
MHAHLKHCERCGYANYAGFALVRYGLLRFTPAPTRHRFVQRRLAPGCESISARRAPSMKPMKADLNSTSDGNPTSSAERDEYGGFLRPYGDMFTISQVVWSQTR